MQSKGLDFPIFFDIILAVCVKGGKMQTNLQQIDEVNRRYVDLAKRHGLNPVWLREIIDLRNRGFNYSQIGARTGISRETVANYLQRLGSMNRQDYWLLVVGTGLIIAGVGIISYFLGKTGSSKKGTEKKDDTNNKS